jgi:hypothetical protein
MWSLPILGFADRCVFQYPMSGFSKNHLYIEIMQWLKLSFQGSSQYLPQKTALEPTYLLQGLNQQLSDKKCSSLHYYTSGVFYFKG